MNNSAMNKSATNQRVTFGFLIFLAVLFIVGGVLLPMRSPDLRSSSAASLWASICSSIGLQAPLQAAPKPAADAFIWTAALENRLAHMNLAPAAEKFADCQPCHGADGRVGDASIPSLEGQSARILLKQMDDFAAGRRKSGIMQAIMQGTPEADREALAQYLSTQKPLVKAGWGPGIAFEDQDNPTHRLAFFGDAARNIPACENCHARATHIADAPDLRVQSRTYLKTQLEAFASGQRSNDLYAPMRAIAAKLSEGERSLLAQFYAGPDGQQQ